MQFVEKLEKDARNAIKLTSSLMIVKRLVDHVTIIWAIVRSVLVKVTVKVAEMAIQKYSGHVLIHPGDL